MKKLWLLTLLTFFLLSTASAQNTGYRINVQIKGLSDTSIYLGNYYGKNQMLIDTIKVDKNGKGLFASVPKDTIGGGIYFIVLPSKKYFEIVLDQERKFSIKTDTVDLLKSMVVEGSKENTCFYEYQKFISDRGKQMENLRKNYDRIKKANPKADSIQILEKQMKDLNESVMSYKEDFIKKYPQSFTAKVFKASKDPVIPEAPILSNGRKDSLFVYYWVRDHYWDDFDLSDERLLRTPLFHGKLETYFDKVIIQHPDSIKAECDKIINKAKKNKETFKYTLWFLTNHYETSQVMGFDAIFVYLVNEYYKTGQVFWVSEKVKKNIIDRANKLEPVLLGSIAPNLILINREKGFTGLHDVKANYTILYFWDPECGHCAKETPKLVDFYNKMKDSLDIKVYAVCTDSSFSRWEKGIIDKHMEKFINVNGTRSALGNFHDLYDIYSTPVVYVLDHRKRIIAKRLGVDQIHDYLIRYQQKPMYKD